RPPGTPPPRAHPRPPPSPTRRSSDLSALYSERIGGFFMRSRAEVAKMFGDLELIEPGLVDLLQWRPDPGEVWEGAPRVAGPAGGDRKSTRRNSSHVKISYAGFRLKKQ